MKETKYWVTMTDPFMSGWGRSEGRKDKLIFICDSYDEALIVAENAENRGDQKRVNIRSSKPCYNSARYFSDYKTKADYPSWYQKGYFKK